jgi:hypothetical protein
MPDSVFMTSADVQALTKYFMERFGLGVKA